MTYFLLSRNKIILICFFKNNLQPSHSMFHSHLLAAQSCATAFWKCINHPIFFLSHGNYFLLWTFIFFLTNNFLNINVILSWFCFNPFIPCNLLKILLCHWTLIFPLYPYISFTISSLYTTLLLFITKSSDWGPFHIYWGQTKKK